MEKGVEEALGGSHVDGEVSVCGKSQDTGRQGWVFSLGGWEGCCSECLLFLFSLSENVGIKYVFWSNLPPLQILHDSHYFIPQLHVVFFKSTECCQRVRGCRAISWNTGSLWGPHPKKTDTLYPRSHSLPVAPQLKVGLLGPFPTHDKFWLI